MAKTPMFDDIRWPWCIPGIALILSGLLPSGDIVASPFELFHPPMWMAPLEWPLVAMGFLFIAAAFSERLRRNYALIVLACSTASILLELVMSEFPGNIAIYSYWFGTDLGNRVLVDFELDVLVFFFIPLDVVMVIGSVLVLWVRKSLPKKDATGS